MASTEHRPPAIYRPVKLPKCSPVCKNSQQDHRKTQRNEDNKENSTTPKEANRQHMSAEVNKISRLVNWKLEYYFDELKKEQNFNVNGRYRTTSRLHKYDLMYKVTEASSLERKRKRKDGKKEGLTNKCNQGKERSVQPKGKHTSSKQTNRSPRKTVIKNTSSRRCKTKEDSDECYIKPNVTSSTMSLTFPTEVKRIVSYANDIWDCNKMKKLTSVHRYLPHGSSTDEEPETPRVLSHSRHPAAVLHADYYVQYYMENGLHTGNPKNNARLLKLRKKTDNTDTDGSSKSSRRSSGQSDVRPVTAPASQKHQSTSNKQQKQQRNGTETTTDEIQKTVEEKRAVPKKHPKRVKSAQVQQPRRSERSVQSDVADKQGTRDQDASEAERSDSDTVQDKDENDSYSDDFEDEEKSTSAADATSIYSYASLVHAEHAEK